MKILVVAGFVFGFGLGLTCNHYLESATCVTAKGGRGVNGGGDGGDAIVCGKYSLLGVAGGGGSGNR